MRLIISLLGILGICLAVAYFGYGIPPKTVYYKTIAFVKGGATSAGNEASNVASATSRFSKVIENRYNSQDMTQPAAR